MKNRKIVFLTLAKGQSLRLKNKNIISFKGKPLIHWVIKKILRISKNYYVNSDSNFILDYSKKIGAKTIKRNKNLLDKCDGNDDCIVGCFDLDYKLIECE